MRLQYLLFTISVILSNPLSAPISFAGGQEFLTTRPVLTDGNEELVKVYQSPDLHEKPLVVGITEFPFYGPENDPDEIIKRWGSFENYENEIPVIRLNDQNFEKVSERERERRDLPPPTHAH